MFERLTQWFAPRQEAAASIVTLPITKGIKPKAASLPSYITSVATTSALPIPDRQLATSDIARFARGTGTRSVLRELAHSSPDISAGMFAYLRTGVPAGYTAVAKNIDGTFNPEATSLAQQLLVRFDILSDYGLGYTGSNSIRSVSESLAKDMWLYGAMSGELVLGKDRLPLRPQAVSVTDITFLQRNDGSLFPQQKRAGETIELDIPTFFYLGLDRELTSAYPSPPMESAIKPVFQGEDFAADLWRVAKRAVHPRVDIAIDEEAFAKSVPIDVQNEGPEAVIAYRNAIEAEIKQKVNEIGPEEALIHFSSVGIQYLNNGNSSLSQEWTVLADHQNSKVATGTKTMPSILGHAASSNISSTEMLQFMKNVEGAITFKLNEFWSRLLTLAVRLFGQDVYVEFKFDRINLRPEIELESFYQTRQTRVLEQLSLGLITDDQASILLNGHLPPPGMAPLSGTQFAAPPPAADTSGANGQNAGGPSNDGSTLNQSLKPKTPATARGGNKK